MKNNLFFITFISLLIVSACDAPRNNPLENFVVEPDTVKIDVPIYTIVKMIDGHIKTRHGSEVPISEVMVSWNRKQGVFTDDLGYYKLLNLEDADEWLYFENEYYHPDSTQVSWNGMDTLNVDFTLDRYPTLMNTRFYSMVQLEHPDEKSGSLFFETEISDDNFEDIVALRLFNEEFSYDKLLETSEAGVFEQLIHETDLKIDEIDGLIGREFLIYANYENGSSFLLGTQQLTRVISYNLEFISPANNTVVQTGNPILKWNRSDPGFNFHYKIQIFTNEVSPELVWESGAISSDVISHRVGTSIPNGEYYWVILLVDENQNSLRSKPASFIVEIPE